MATLTINGQKVTVDDSFRDLTLEQQEATVEEIARSLGANNAPQAEPSFDDLPWYQQAGQAADDVMRLVANGMTFGYADKLAGYMSGDGTDAERAATEAARERAGSAGTAAELVGAVATPVGLSRQGATLAGRFGTGAMTGAKGLGWRSLLMGAEGAGYGALTAAGNDQDIAQGAGYGAIGGAAGNVAGEALSAGLNKVAGAFNKSPKIPNIEEIDALKDAAFKRAEQAGVMYTPKAVERINGNLANELAEFGYDPALMPGAKVAIERLQSLEGQNVTLKGLDTIRKVASNGFIPGNKANNAVVSKVINAIDDLMENASGAEVLMGDKAMGAAAIKEARSLSSRVAKAGRVQQALTNAEIDAAASGSGGNVNNRTRQLLKPLAKNPRGFTADERAAIDTAIRGTVPQNAMRLAGKLSPSGNGLMAALGVGGAMVNPAIGVLSLGGMGAKALADRGTQANVDRLVKIILAGGSRAATEAAPNAVQRLAQSKREAIARALMAIGANTAGTE